MSSLAKLALADGTVYTGTAFGADGEIFGEVVFNTSMTGYQEILTDPSYCGQIVTMTYPLIGNYGINEEDIESSGLSLSGFIVRELCREPSNYRSTKSLDQYLREAGIVGLEGIDTRALVRRIRVHGAMTGVLSTADLDDASLVRKAQSSPDLVGRDLVQEVMPEARSDWHQGLSALGIGFRPTGAGTFAPQTPGRDSARRRHRLRHEVEHSAAPDRARLPRDGRSRQHLGRRSARPRTGRRLPLERAGRSAAPRLRGRHDPQLARARNRSSASAWGISSWVWRAAARSSS